MGTVVELKKRPEAADANHNDELAHLFSRLAKEAKEGKIACVAGIALYRSGGTALYAAGVSQSNTARILKAVASLAAMLVA